jgi:hypothetical protein
LTLPSSWRAASASSAPSPANSKAGLDDFGGVTVQQIDVDGDGQMGGNDMEIALNNLNGPLGNWNFNFLVQ